MLAFQDKPTTYTSVVRPIAMCDAKAVWALRNELSVRAAAIRGARMIPWGDHISWMARVALLDSDACAWVSVCPIRGNECEMLGVVWYIRCVKGAIISLHVRPEARRLGVAKRMIKATIDDAMESLGVNTVSAAVLVDNTGSRGLFRKLRWENLGIGELYDKQVEIHQYPPWTKREGGA